ncbi:MAG: HDOD domain-containing protein, partial [Myxococcales bacterium]|nr:HDOD domain-containing protein [Myxococcales bacterium]
GSSLFKAGQYQARVQRVFEQAVLVARAARRVAALSRLDPDLAFLAGLLHDVGRARCYRILARRRLRRDPIEVEEAVEMLHAQAGAELAEAWNLPPAVAEACAHHAAPGPEQVMSRVVAIAADLVSVLDAHDPEGLVARGVLEKLAMLGVRDANVSSLIEDCRGDREQRGHSSPSFG